jgi:hypothetical protein
MPEFPDEIAATHSGFFLGSVRNARKGTAHRSTPQVEG